MSYIEKNLMAGERLLYRGNLHWVVFLWPVVFFVAGILCFNGSTEAEFFGVIFILVSLVAGPLALINYKTSEFGITNKRIVVKVGFIRRSSIEVLLNKVEGIQVDQGILGRILGFGSITVSGTGGTKDPINKISAPLEFRKKAQEQIASVQES